LFTMSQKLSRQALSWTAGVLALALMVCLILPGARASVIGRLKSFNLQNQDIQHRLGSWPVLQALHGHWMFGVGYGNYGKVYAPYYRGPFPFLDEPDNQYFRWLIENGLAGLAAFGIFLVGLV